MPRLNDTNKAILYLKRSIENQTVALKCLENQATSEVKKSKIIVKKSKKMGRPKKS